MYIIAETNRHNVLPLIGSIFIVVKSRNIVSYKGTTYLVQTNSVFNLPDFIFSVFSLFEVAQ